MRMYLWVFSISESCWWSEKRSLGWRCTLYPNICFVVRWRIKNGCVKKKILCVKTMSRVMKKVSLFHILKILCVESSTNSALFMASWWWLVKACGEGWYSIKSMNVLYKLKAIIKTKIMWGNLTHWMSLFFSTFLFFAFN